VVPIVYASGTFMDAMTASVSGQNLWLGMRRVLRLERVEGRGVRYTTVRLLPLYLWTVGLAGSLVVWLPTDMTSLEGRGRCACGRALSHPGALMADPGRSALAVRNGRLMARWLIDELKRQQLLSTR
jgi:hypothetical protein